MSVEEMIEFVKEADSNGWRSDAVVAALSIAVIIKDRADSLITAIDVGDEELQLRRKEELEAALAAFEEDV